MKTGVSILENQILKSPLAGTSSLRPGSGKKKRSLAFTLMLTSLIDAFSMLVIFLLMNYSSANREVEIRRGTELPMAESSKAIDEGTVVEISQGKYFVDKQQVSMGHLAEVLSNLKAKIDRTAKKAGEKDQSKAALIIQADRKVDYSVLSPVILAGSRSGFHSFKFAVIQNEGQSSGGKQ